MYNFYMPLQEGKKVETVTVKVNAKNREEFQKICKEEDRSMSYVVRELALRGLAQYKKDGILKISEEEENLIVNSNSNQATPVLSESGTVKPKKVAPEKIKKVINSKAKKENAA